MKSERFEHPDKNGFFHWDGGRVWAFDGDRYVLRGKNGTEIAVMARVEDGVEFYREGEDETDVDPVTEIDGEHWDFLIKPAGATDRLALHITITGDTAEVDVAALDQALSGKREGGDGLVYHPKERITP
ncbi:MAG: hypothetical protein IH626_22935 [Rhodospirillales bacterium]|nr:hypothetical protein [Rhodospirillales bacterium]